jgi:hypothetical protein
VAVLSDAERVGEGVDATEDARKDLESIEGVVEGREWASKGGGC